MRRQHFGPRRNLESGGGAIVQNKAITKAPKLGGLFCALMLHPRRESEARKSQANDHCAPLFSPSLRPVFVAYAAPLVCALVASLSCALAPLLRLRPWLRPCLGPCLGLLQCNCLACDYIRIYAYTEASRGVLWPRSGRSLAVLWPRARVRKSP